MIVEGLVTTTDADGGCHISAMGPCVSQVNDEIRGLVLRPYQSSRTFANLMRHPQGVFHVTDDVEMIARAALHQWGTPPKLRDAGRQVNFVLNDACRWWAFRVTEANADQERAELRCRVEEKGRLRDFLGFQRARHAVLEATILATRLKFLPRDHIEQEMARLAVIVDKTAGEKERFAFDLVRDFIAENFRTGA